MKKALTRGILFFLIAPFILSSMSYFVFCIPSMQQTTGVSNFIIYVNSTIAPSIQSEIAQYKTDVEAKGYTVKIYNWTDSNIDLMQRAVSLKANITAEYINNGLNGTVLIGDMPYVFYEDGSGIYICDLYFMDMDGTWDNPNGDLDFDSHIDGSGDMYPEIFIGRINPRPVNNTHEVSLLQAYFQRNHEFHAGNTVMFNNSLMYIDDSWEVWSQGWKGDMEFLYDNITLVNNTIETTNSTNYMKEIIKPYDFGHIFIHSDSTTHYFINGSLYWVDGTISSSQLKIIDTTPKFLNLYCCYASSFDVQDNLGTQYLFSSNNTLAVFGATTSGGFQMNQYLYEPLANGWTLGESFRNWWFNDILDPIVHTHGPSDPTVRGNVLLGDPCLTIRDISEEEVPHGKLSPLELSMIIVGPILLVGIISLIIVHVKNKKAKINN